MYNKYGVQQWVNQYNGTGSGDDIATAIALYEGDIFVTGISKGDTTNEDYVTIKYNSTGTVQWVSRYDYTNLVEIPAAIEFMDNGSVLVTGASGSSIASWDITTVNYNNATGNEINVKRETGSGYGFNQPADMRKDNQGNIIITGQVRNLQGDYDIKTIKMDSNLDTVWTVIYDGHNLNDIPSAMDVDINGNIYITGYSDNGSGKEMVNLMYDASGSLTWSDIIFSQETNGVAQGKQIKVDLHGNFYATGVIDHDNTKDIITMRYDTAQNVKWRRYYNGDGNNDDKPYDMIINNKGKVYVSGITDNGDKYITLKYSTYDKPTELQFDSTGTPIFIKGEIIVRFDTSVVKKAAIDKRGLQFGNATTFLKDTVITIMNSVLPIKVDDLTFVKIFSKMTTADSISTTRLGEVIKVSPFWSSFTMEIPEGEELSYSAILDTLYPIIQYSHIDACGTLDNIPNDDLITTQQEGLIPTATYPNAHINMNEAWDYEVGQPFVKVGVFDFPIYWAHEDFGDGTYSGSKINGGWDYVSNQEISGVTTVTYSHGTSVAGIIGALRNNNKGIAGIAGGDIDNDNNPGVSLYSFGISKTDGWIPISTASSAIIVGSLNCNSGYGYGLDIQNHSWGIELGVTYIGGHTVNQNDITLLLDATQECYRNKCVFVVSRGNDGDTDEKYPACSKDMTVISVGASGYNGEYHNGISGDYWWASSYGGNVDVIAPGVTQIVAAPIYTGAPYDWLTCAVNLSGYSCFNGTSAAAPHIAGVASLMYSRHNTQNGYPNNLAPEDIENILQKNATDKGVLGYDDYNGWGLVNAGEAVKKVSGHYKVYHSTTSSTSTQTTVPNQYIMLSENIGGVAAGNYIADRIQVTQTFLDVFGPNAQVIDKWSRYSSSYGYSAGTPVSDDTWAEYTYTISGNVVAVTTTTFCWHILTTIGGQAVDT